MTGMAVYKNGRKDHPPRQHDPRSRLRAAFDRRQISARVRRRAKGSRGDARRWRESRARPVRARWNWRRAALRCLRRQPAPSAARERRRDVIVYVSGGHPSDVTSAARARRGAPGRARRSSRPRASRVQASVSDARGACRATSGDVSVRAPAAHSRDGPWSEKTRRLVWSISRAAAAGTTSSPPRAQQRAETLFSPLPCPRGGGTPAWRA